MTIKALKERLVSHKKATLVTLLTLAFIVITIWTSDPSRIEQWVIDLRQILAQTGFWGPILFSIAYIVLGLIGFSETIMSFIALGLFSPVIAFLIVFIASTVSAQLAFIIARRVLPGLGLNTQSIPFVRRISQKIEEQASTHSFRLILLLRFSRLPYIALSYAAGTQPSVSMWWFVAATAVTNFLSAVFYVVLGVTFAAYFGIAFIVVAVVAIGVLLFRRGRAGRKKSGSNQDSSK